MDTLASAVSRRLHEKLTENGLRGCLVFTRAIVSQKASLRATWPTRGFPTDRMRPKSAALILWFGSFGFTWLRALKNSPRNWSLQRSFKEKFLDRLASSTTIPGPRRAFLPNVPNVPAAGRAKAALFSQGVQPGVFPQPVEL